MSGVPAGTDFRTRVLLRLLWWRRAYSFLWAHHPLCERFRGDVLDFGGVRLCRSCLAVYCGMFLATVAAATTPIPSAPAFPFLLAIPTIALSHPGIYKRLPRVFRDVLRLSMGVLIVFCGSLFLAGHFFSAAVLLAVIFAFWRYYFRLRRTRRLAACEGCGELDRDGVCSGYAVQAAHIRLYESEATRLLYSRMSR